MRVYNLARMTTATTGTGTITLGSAVANHVAFGTAGVEDGETVSYAIEDGADSEVGFGVYTSSGTTLTRNLLRSTTGSLLNLSGNAQVFITPSAEDFGPAVNAQTGTSYTLLSSDIGKLVTFSNASSIAVTLPQATGRFKARFYCWIKNVNAGVVTLTPTTSTINGLTTITLGQHQGVMLISDGTNWFTAALPANRETLNAARTYYVRTDGSDSNTGLANNSGGAFLTVQKAIDVAAGLDTSIYDVTIQIGSGTYTTSTGLVLKNAAGAGAINIVGDTGTPSNVVITTNGTMTGSQGIFLANALNTVYKLSGMRLSSTASGTIYGIHVIGCYLEFATLDFNTGITNHVRVADNSSVSVTGNYSITGGSGAHWDVIGGGLLRCQSRTITLTGTPAFSTAFASIGSSGICVANGLTFSGSATGTRYSVTLNSVLNTAGGGASYFPGDVAGSAATGGQYA
jgi:hypothetical protein